MLLQINWLLKVTRSTAASLPMHRLYYNSSIGSKGLIIMEQPLRLPLVINVAGHSGLEQFADFRPSSLLECDTNGDSGY